MLNGAESQATLIEQAEQDEVEDMVARQRRKQYRIVVVALVMLGCILPFAFILKLLQAKEDTAEVIPPIRRLQSHIIPNFYTVNINADEKTNRITGSVSVSLDVKKAGTRLDIHSVEGQKLIGISLKETYKNGDQRVDNQVLRTVYDNAQDVLEIHFAKQFGPCKAVLTFNYISKILSGLSLTLNPEAYILTLTLRLDPQANPPLNKQS